MGGGGGNGAPGFPAASARGRAQRIWGKKEMVADRCAREARADFGESGSDRVGGFGTLRKRKLYFSKQFLINAEINRNLRKILSDLIKI
jgi:hypothetical protein